MTKSRSSSGLRVLPAILASVIVIACVPELRECVLRTIVAMLAVDNPGVLADSIVDTRDSRGVGAP